MRARRLGNVFTRKEPFGGTVYVHERNDFFFLDSPSFSFIEKIGPSWTQVPPDKVFAYRRLAGLGIYETADPSTKQRAHCGPAFIGTFDDIPKVSNPLVLNCFSTAHCPLRCVYCHADDLMQNFRREENMQSVQRVIKTARLVPAMMVVITGGDPFTRPDRTKELVEGIGHSKPMVLDTSGVPNDRKDLEWLIPLLKRHSVHVRVSLDALDDVNKRTRPINPKYIDRKSSSFLELVSWFPACLFLPKH